MQAVIAFVLFSVFSALALLHFYWGVGGRWGYEAALPTTEDNQKLMNPRFLECMVVGGGLLGFGLLVLIKSGIINFSVWTWLCHYGLWAIIFIFSARAIGDFRYVGFFKTVKKTQFGQLDTKFYSPLCSLIAFLTTLIEFKIL